MKKKKGKTFQHTIASGIASFTSTFLFHPFETVRARLQGKFFSIFFKI